MESATNKEGEGAAKTAHTYAEALKNNIQIPSYGAKIKGTVPPISYPSVFPDIKVEVEGNKAITTISKEADERLLQPFSWTLRGSFKCHRASIKEVDEAFHSSISPSNTIQVTPLNKSEVMIRLFSEKDFIRATSKNAIKVGSTQMRITRWSPSPTPNLSLAAVWHSISGLPPHLANPACLAKILSPWGALLAVHDDVKYLTRPELTKVCLEIDLSKERPTELIVKGSYGTTCSKVWMDYEPRWCNRCGLMGHLAEECRRESWNKRSRKNCCQVSQSKKNSQQAQKTYGEKKQEWRRSQKAKSEKDSNWSKEGEDLPLSPNENAEAANVKSRQNASHEIPTKTDGISDELKGEMDPIHTHPGKHVGGISKEKGECSNTNLEDPHSPSASTSPVSAHKNPFGPFLWSSLAGDLHLNYEMCKETLVKNIRAGIPFERRPNIPTKDYNQPISSCHPKRREPKHTCIKCSTTKVERKGSMCKICVFQGPRRQGRKKPLLSPPKYDAKTEECFFIKSKDNEWEIDAKEELLEVVASELAPIIKAAGKVGKSPSSNDKPERNIPKGPPKKWGDMSSEDESSLEENQIFQDAVEDLPKNWGKKINSRIGNPKVNETRRTRSGKDTDTHEDGKREKWIEGIRLLKTKHYDQRHNTTWFQWEVAPEVVLSRNQKKRIEHIAQKGENQE